MPGDHPKGVLTIQTELNRHALVEIGKRLTELEHKFVSLDSDAQDLRYLSVNSLETAKRLQGMVKGLLDRRKRTESQESVD
jgi:hypothetical protein